MVEIDSDLIRKWTLEYTGNKPILENERWESVTDALGVKHDFVVPLKPLHALVPGGNEMSTLEIEQVFDGAEYPSIFEEGETI